MRVVVLVLSLVLLAPITDSSAAQDPSQPEPPQPSERRNAEGKVPPSAHVDGEPAAQAPNDPYAFSPSDPPGRPSPQRREEVEVPDWFTRGLGEPPNQPSPERLRRLTENASPGQEIPELRTETAKAFATDTPGRIEVAEYLTPLHFEDGSRGWQEIDPSLHRAGSGWRNGAAAFDLSIDPSRRGLARLELEPGVWVQTDISGRNPSRPAREISADQERGSPTPSLPGQAQPSRPRSVRIDEATSGGFSYELTSTPTGLKDAIILSEPSQARSLSYEITTSGLTAVQQESGDLVFTDRGGEERAWITTPVVFDSAEEIVPSKNLIPASTTLRSVGRGSYELSLDIDSGWLSSPDRVWPVVVDPQLVGVPATRHTTVVEGINEPIGLHAIDFMDFGYNSQLDRSQRAYFSSAPLDDWVGYKVESGQMFIAPILRVNCPPQGFAIHQVMEWWGEGGAPELHWGNQPALSHFKSLVPGLGTCQPGQDTQPWMTLAQNLPQDSVDITELIQSWFTFFVGSYGVAIRSINEQTSTSWMRAASSLHPNPPYIFFVAEAQSPPSLHDLSPPNDALTSETPTISFRYEDTDGEEGEWGIAVWEWDDGEEIEPDLALEFGTVEVGQTVSYTLPAGMLEEGKSYGWGLEVGDEQGARRFRHGDFTWAGPPTVEVTTNAAGDLVTGDRARITATITNPSIDQTELTFTSNPELGMIPLAGTATIDGTPCSLPECVFTPQSFEATATLPASDTLEIAFDVQILSSDLLCTTRSVDWSVENTLGWHFDPPSGNLPVDLCGEGLGLEPYWTYLSRDLGPDGIAQINVANGNLVVSHTDAPPVQGRGSLAYVVRRTYNSQAPGALLPIGVGGIGDGWTMNVTTAGELGGMFSPIGLVVDPAGAAQALVPGVVMVDRYGTRHTFTPDETHLSIELPSALTYLLDGLSTDPGSLLDRLIEVLNDVTGGSLDPGGVAVCLDTTYNSPPGVHLDLWRFTAVEIGTSCAGAPTEDPLVLGYATMRPDGVRQVFSITGQLLALTDAAGNGLRYNYDPLGRLNRVWEPGVCPDPDAGSHCRSMQITYPNPSTTIITDPAGREITYSHPNNALEEVTTRSSTGQVLETWSYDYGGCGDPDALCEITSPNGDATSLSYDDISPSGPRVTSIAERHDASDPGPGQSELTTQIDYSSAPISATTTATRSDRAVRFNSIDRFGRVGERLEGDPQDVSQDEGLRRETYTWDRPDTPGEPAISCRPVDDGFDHHLCSLTRHHGSVDTTDAPPGWAASGDEITEFAYTPEGELAFERTALDTGWLTTTHGYVTHYTAPDGTVTTVDDEITGHAIHSSDPRPQGSLYKITGRVEIRTPRANHTTFTLDRNAVEDPGTVIAGSCGQGNSGLLCQSDAPEGVTTSYQYDTFGQRTELHTPKRNAEGGSPFTYSYMPTGSVDLTSSTGAAGWLRAVTDPEGNFVAFGYDRSGNVVRTWDRNATEGGAPGSYPGSLGSPPPDFAESRYGQGSSAQAYANPWRYMTGEADALSNTTTYTLDPHGNPTQIRPPRGNEAGNDSFDVVSAYDARDQLISQAFPAHPTDAFTYSYDESGNLTATEDPNGSVTTTSFDAANREVAFHFTRGDWADRNDTEEAACRESSGADAPIPPGRILCETITTYDGLDRVVARLDPNKAPTWTRFDQAGRPASTFTLRDQGVWLTHNQSFDPDANLIHDCPPRQADEEPATACGPGAHFSLHHTYDALGRLTQTQSFIEAINPTTGVRTGGWESSLTSATYDADSNPQTITDPRGVETSFDFDLQARLLDTAVERETGTTITQTRDYDPAGNVISEAFGQAGQAPTNLRSHRYDAANRLVDSVDAATDPNASANSNTFLATEEVAEPANLRTRHLYDADSNVVAVFGPRAFTSSVTDPDPRFMTRFELDENGRVFGTWEPMWDSTLHRDNTNLAYTQECPPTGGSHQPFPVAGVPAWPSTTGVCVSKVEYDGVGNLTRQTSPNATAQASAGQFTDFRYTDDYLPREIEAPNPAASSPGQSPRHISQALSYDPVGRLIETKDPLDWINAAHYTPDGLMTRQEAFASGAALHSLTEYDHDAAGNVVATHTMISPTRTDTQTASYNADGSTYETSTQVSGHNAGAVTWRWGYDPSANPTQVWSPSAVVGAANNTAGVPTIHSFTGDGLLEATIEPVEPDGSVRRHTAYTYNPLGRKTSQETNEINGTNPGSIVEAGGVRSFANSPSGLPHTETGRGGEEITSTYYADGSPRSQEDDTSGVEITYLPYLNSAPHTISSQAPVGYPPRHQFFAPHADGTLQTRGQSTTPAFTSFEYFEVFSYSDARVLTDVFAQGWGHSLDNWQVTSDHRGLPTSRSDPGSRFTTYDRNPSGTLQEKTLYEDILILTVEVDEWTYTYDSLDRATSRTRSSTLPVGQVPQYTDSFDYDEAGRLSSLNSTPVFYDPNSNRLGIGSPSTSYRADNTIAGLPHTPWGGREGDGCITSTYDGHDRLAQKSPSTCGEAGNTTFVYDPLSREAAKLDSSASPNRVLRWWGGTNQLAQEEASGTPGQTSRYTQTPDGQPLSASNATATPTVHGLHSDGMGNTVLATGLLTLPPLACAVNLDPWGDERNALSETNPCTLGTSHSTRWFGGASRTPSTGEYRFGARTYDPQTATWLTPDQTGAQAPITDLSIGTDPLLANRYAYVNGDPINLWDPSGRCVRLRFWETSARECGRAFVEGSNTLLGYSAGLLNSLIAMIEETINILDWLAALPDAGLNAIADQIIEPSEEQKELRERQPLSLPRFPCDYNAAYQQGCEAGEVVGTGIQIVAGGYGAIRAAVGGVRRVPGAYRWARGLLRGADDVVPPPVLRRARELPPSQRSNPWPVGDPGVAMPAPQGMRIQMAMSPGQTRPGGFGTLDDIPDLAFIRQKLAVLPEWKPAISHVQTYEIPAGVRIQVGPVGTQRSGGVLYPGGATQVEILNYADRARLIPIGQPRPVL